MNKDIINSKINNNLIENILHIQENHFECFEESFNDLKKSLDILKMNKSNYMNYQNKQNLIDKIYLINQSLFEVQDKIQTLTYNILNNNYDILNENDKQMLEDYKDLNIMQKKAYSYLSLDNLINSTSYNK